MTYHKNKPEIKILDVLKAGVQVVLILAYVALAVWATVEISWAIDLPEILTVFLAILVILFAIPVGLAVFYYFVVRLPVRRICQREEFLTLQREKANEVRHCNELYALLSALEKERPHLSPIEEENKNLRTFTCTYPIYNEVKKYPFPALFRHFDISESLETVHTLEHMLLNVRNTEQALLWVIYLHAQIQKTAEHLLPAYLRRMGLNEIGVAMGLPDISTWKNRFMTYRFEYTPKENAHFTKTVDVVMDSETIEETLAYLNKKLQNPYPCLTTERINSLLLRDGCTCEVCGASAELDVHLNMELAYIKSPSDGGVCVEENFRVVCHACAAKQRRSAP